MQKKEYDIGGKTYTQGKLVLGQLRQLLPVVSEVSFPERFAVADLVQLMGDRLPDALAVILVEKGKDPSQKDLAAESAFMSWNVPVGTSIEIMKDFFDCNPPSSLLTMLETAVDTIGGMTRKIGSKTPSSALPAGT